MEIWQNVKISVKLKENWETLFKRIGSRETITHTQSAKVTGAEGRDSIAVEALCCLSGQRAHN